MKTVGHEQFYDLTLAPEDCSLEKSLSHFGVEPDLILLECFGPKPFFRGIEESPYPLALYAVDSTINMYWLKSYAKLFDFVFVDQKKAVDSMADAGVEAFWLPLAIESSDFEGIEITEEFDITFVGRVNPLRGKRISLLEELKRNFSLAVAGGDGNEYLNVREAARFHARGKMALNENLFDGVTQRIFEVMASGAMLLTEAVQDGLSELFADGAHLITFTPENLLEKVKYYLRNPAERRSIASRGRAEVLRNHSCDVRAEKLLKIIVDGKTGAEIDRDIPARYADSARAYYLASLRWAELAQGLLARTEKACLNALESRPGNVEMIKIMGLLHGKWGSYSRAADHFLKAMEVSPDDIESCLFLGHLLNKYGQQDVAARYFSMGVARIENALPESKAAAMALLQNSTIEGEAWVALGDVLRSVFPPWEPGFSKYEPDEFPTYPAEYYDKAFRETGSADGMTALGDCYAETGVHDAALRCFLMALEFNPGNAVLYIKAGTEALKIYRRREGLQLLGKAARLAPAMVEKIMELPLNFEEIDAILDILHSRGRRSLKMA